MIDHAADRIGELSPAAQLATDTDDLLPHVRERPAVRRPEASRTDGARNQFARSLDYAF